MTYDDALAWWYGCIDFERRAPKPSDLKLEQMRMLLHRLGNPQDRLRIIHVAGSKGKGSTSAMLASVLGAAGYHVGLFTSPHLCAVEERIQVDGSPIGAAELAALLTEVRTHVGDDLQPTFFEVGTALGWLHFVRRQVDAAVVEVGLGGRFDSTNVCEPLLSLITSISYDHTMILGDRLEQIAFEKAGILKPGKPAVSGATGPEAAAVIRRAAKERGVPLTELDRDFRFRYEPAQVDRAPPRVTVQTRESNWPTFELGLLGAHQAANAAVVVAAVERLRRDGFVIPEDKVSAGLRNVRWPARLEVVGRRPWIVLDCAHNTASVQAMVETLAESFPPGRRCVILAVSNDKDATGMLRRLAPHFAHFILTQFQKNPRAVPATELANTLKEIAKVSTEVRATPAEALKAARQWAGPDDLIAITGSIFLAGEMLCGKLLG